MVYDKIQFKLKQPKGKLKAVFFIINYGNINYGLIFIFSPNISQILLKRLDFFARICYNYILNKSTLQ